MFAASIYGYRFLHGSWLWFAVLFLFPDLAMIAYAAGVQAGAAAYNLLHNEGFPLLLALISFHQQHWSTLLFALIWLAHIGFDRLLGYGLKYPTHFKDTHLQRL